MSDNLIKEAYNACCIDNRDSLGNYLSIESFNIPERQYTLDIWVYISGNSEDIISQENGIRLGIVNNMLCFYHPAIGNKTVSGYGPLPKKQRWMNLLLSCNGNKVSFALDGVSAGEITCQGASLSKSAPIRLGYGFHGYIRSFRCYDHVVEAVNYKDYIYQTTFDAASMPGLMAFMDFTQLKMPDISGHGAKAILHGSCGVMNLVPVYVPSKGKYATVNLGDDINPGGFASGKLSIYIKTYIRPLIKDCQVIASNGNFNEPDCVILFMEKTSDKGQLCIQLGSQHAAIGEALEAFQWVDILISYENGKITAFINGISTTVSISAPKRNQKGEFRLGNGFDQDNPSADYTCEHYLFTAAVFDKALAQEDADSFLENHPFIFEDGVVALLSFSSSPCEMTACRQIQMDEDDVILAQRTLDQLPETPYDYRINMEHNGLSNMKKWEAESIWSSLTTYYESSMALKPTLKEEQKKAVLYSIATDKTLLQVFAPLFTTLAVTGTLTAGCISKMQAEKMMRLLKMGRFLSGKTPAAGGTVASGISLTVSAGAGLAEIGKSLAILNTAVPAIAASLVVVACILSEKRKDKPQNEEDDTDLSLKITSLSFQHAPDNFEKSSVRCRTAKGPMIAPEWTSQKKEGGEAVYIADKIGKVEIKFKFIITDNSTKPKGLYDVSVWAFGNNKDAVFTEMKYDCKGLKAGIEYEGNLAVTTKSISGKDIVYQDLELWWNYKINGVISTTANTKHRIYFLPTVPVEPVYLQEQYSENSIPLELLALFSKNYTANESGRDKAVANRRITGLTPDDLKYFTDLVYSCGAFRYDPQAHPYVRVCDVKEHEAPYTLHGYLDMLDVTSMLNQIGAYVVQPATTPKVEANCNVYASILSYFFAVYGVFSTVSIITTMDPNKHLHTNPLIGAGTAVAVEFDFSYHAIVKVPVQPMLPAMITERYFDACCRLPGGVAPANVMFRSVYTTPQVQATENTTYRGMVFKVGTEAVVTSNRLYASYGMINP